MIHEDKNQISSNSDGGGDGGGSITISSSKKLKQKKVPQRGLGVAQLEKIRIGGQQIEDSSSTLSSTNSSSLHTNPLPNYPPTITNNYTASKLDLPYNPPSPPPPMSMNVSPPNAIFRTRLSPNTENFNLGTTPSLNPTNGDEFGVGWPSIPVQGGVSFPNMWHPNSHEFGVDHKENSNFWPNLSLPCETCSIAPLPNVLPRCTQRNQPLPSNSVVNVSSINLSSSCVLSFPMEPPSNQSFYSNFSPLWSDKEKMMAGMKRSCPFPLDNHPIPTFHSKFVPLATHPLNRSDESAPGAFGGTTYNHLDSGIPIFREIPSCPSAMPEPVISKKINKSENGTSHNTEFLSLAPSPTTSFTNPRLQQLCKFETLPCQASSIEDPLMDSRKGSSSQQQSDLLSFFPPTKLPTTTPVSPSANHNLCNGEVGEYIDLNLRL